MNVQDFGSRPRVGPVQAAAGGGFVFSITQGGFGLLGTFRFQTIHEAAQAAREMKDVLARHMSIMSRYGGPSISMHTTLTNIS